MDVLSTGGLFSCMAECTTIVSRERQSGGDRVPFYLVAMSRVL